MSLVLPFLGGAVPMRREQGVAPPQDLNEGFRDSGGARVREVPNDEGGVVVVDGEADLSLRVQLAHHLAPLEALGARTRDEVLHRPIEHRPHLLLHALEGAQAQVARPVPPVDHQQRRHGAPRARAEEGGQLRQADVNVGVEGDDPLAAFEQVGGREELEHFAREARRREVERRGVHRQLDDVPCGREGWRCGTCECALRAWRVELWCAGKWNVCAMRVCAWIGCGVRGVFTWRQRMS